jgi:hypothetical protein
MITKTWISCHGMIKLEYGAFKVLKYVTIFLKEKSNIGFFI